MGLGCAGKVGNNLAKIDSLEFVHSYFSMSCDRLTVGYKPTTFKNGRNQAMGSDQFAR